MTTAPLPKAVLFDLFHTLVCSPPAGGEFGLPMGEALGIPHLHREFMRRFHDDDVLNRCLGHIRDPHETIRLLAHGFDPTIPNERIEIAVADRRRRMQHCMVHVEPAMLEALDTLRAAGIKTALVSDAAWDDVEYWEGSPLVSRFDSVVFSYELGFRKPDRRIYERALSGIGEVAADAIFVGDGGSDEHRGARDLGMRTVLVTRLISQWRPECIEERRLHADSEFADVPEFVRVTTARRFEELDNTI